MDKDKKLGEVERGQQQLRASIAESDRMIGEAQQRVATSKAFAAAPAMPVEPELAPTELPSA